MMAPFYDVHSYDNDECGVGNEDEVHNDGLADEDNETDHDGDHGAGDRGEPVHGRGDGPADPREVHEGRQEEGETEEKNRAKITKKICFVCGRLAREYFFKRRLEGREDRGDENK